MDIKELAKISEDDFVGAFQTKSVADFVHMMKSELGVEVKAQGKKSDILAGAYAQIQELAHGPAAPPAGVPSLPPAPAGEARLFRVRSRQPQGRWRDGRHFVHTWQEIPEAEITEAQRADPVLEFREVG